MRVRTALLGGMFSCVVTGSGCLFGASAVWAQSVDTTTPVYLAPVPGATPAAAPAPAVSAVPPPTANPPKPAKTQVIVAAPTPARTPDSAEPVAEPKPVAAPKPVVAIKKRPEPKLETELPTDPNPTYQADTLTATQKAADHYADIVKTGGWPTDITALNLHSIGPEVAKLRKRLAIEGDQPVDEPTQGPAAQIWDRTLTESVKRFQSRLGLKMTGVVAGETLKELNVPAETRAAALAASAARMSLFTFGFGDRYVVVNLPSTSVEAIENGQVAHRYVAIVGDPDHPSPQIAAHITQVTLNPTWTVPVSIIKKEIIPRMQKNPGYLARQKIRILDANGAEVDAKSIDWNTNRAVNYTLRQDSGAGNSLGAIRVNMPNKLAVYMHDTPSKRLFGADYRFLSHGCVRVQGVFDYAEWLLEGSHQPDGSAWDRATMEAKVKEGGRIDIKVEKPTNVIWLYLTGWANDDGIVHFRDDPYGLDNPAVAAKPGDATVATSALPAPTSSAAQAR